MALEANNPSVTLKKWRYIKKDSNMINMRKTLYTLWAKNKLVKKSQ